MSKKLIDTSRGLEGDSGSEQSLEDLSDHGSLRVATITFQSFSIWTQAVANGFNNDWIVTCRESVTTPLSPFLFLLRAYILVHLLYKIFTISPSPSSNLLLHILINNLPPTSQQPTSPSANLQQQPNKTRELWTSSSTPPPPPPPPPPHHPPHPLPPLPPPTPSVSAS